MDDAPVEITPFLGRSWLRAGETALRNRPYGSRIIERMALWFEPKE
jgi:hypothetical protein